MHSLTTDFDLASKDHHQRLSPTNIQAIMKVNMICSIDIRDIFYHCYFLNISMNSTPLILKCVNLVQRKVLINQSVFR